VPRQPDVSGARPAIALPAITMVSTRLPIFGTERPLPRSNEIGAALFALTTPVLFCRLSSARNPTTEPWHAV
jgi:hypothetical protein